MKEVEVLKVNNNYTVGNIGEFKELDEYEYLHPTAKMYIQGKVFVGEKLNMSGTEISFQVLKPGQGMPFEHMHMENEEVYVVLKGNGEFIIDDEITKVSEGFIITIKPKAKRTWRNNSENDFVIMVIQAAYRSLNHFNVTDGYR